MIAAIEDLPPPMLHELGGSLRREALGLRPRGIRAGHGLARAIERAGVPAGGILVFGDAAEGVYDPSPLREIARSAHEVVWGIDAMAEIDLPAEAAADLARIDDALGDEDPDRAVATIRTALSDLRASVQEARERSRRRHEFAAALIEGAERLVAEPGRA